MRVLWVYMMFCFLPSTLSIVVADKASKRTVVNIGALFGFNSTIGKVAKIAIQEAVNDVNSNSTILRGVKLNLISSDSMSNGFLGFIQAMKMMEREVVAVVGPQSSDVAYMVTRVASELHIPLVSFAVTDMYLTPSQSPYFVRTSNSDLYQMTAIADIVDYFKWREVVAIFIDNDYGRNGIGILGNALSNRRNKLVYKGALSPDEGLTRSDVMDVLIRVSVLGCRVIVLHVNPKVGALVSEVASYLGMMGMMGNGYAWICTEWLSTYIDTYSPLSSELMNMMQGVIALRQHIPDSNVKRAFFSNWKNISSLGLNVFGLYAYDSVWLIAKALNLFLGQGGNISFSNDSRLRSLYATNLHLEALHIFDGGPDLLNNILQNSLMGLTGSLKFDSDRSRNNPAYDIINVAGNGYREIGYWSNYSGLSIVPPEELQSMPHNILRANQQLRSVLWPDGSTTTPRGWIFPIRGKLLKIGVPVRVSFKDFVSRVSGSNDMFEGFCIDVFQAAVSLLPYPVPYQFVGFGDGNKNPNYTDLVNMIATGNFDAAVGDIAIVTSRTRTADFTQPYASSGLVVVTPFKEVNSGPWAFLRPFTPGMWGFIIVAFIAIGVVVWGLEHRINDEFRGSPRQQCLTILWFGFSTLTFSHRENTVSFLARIVLIIWLFVVLILTSSYTASLTSILTVQQLTSNLKGMDSLRKSNEPIGYQVGSYAQKYMTEELDIAESRLVPLNSPKEYTEALRYGRVCAVVDERPYIELFLSSQCEFRIVGEAFTRSGWGFAFPRDSPLAPDLSTAILQLSEDGDLQRIYDKWLTTSSCSQDNTEIDSTRLSVKTFWGLFLICGISCVISIAVFFTKIFRRLNRVSRNVVSDIGERSNLRSVQTLMYMIDEKKEPYKKKKRIDQSNNGFPLGDDN